jgi:hypothetical protein
LYLLELEFGFDEVSEVAEGVAAVVEAAYTIFAVVDFAYLVEFGHSLNSGMKSTGGKSVVKYHKALCWIAPIFPSEMIRVFLCD